MRGCILSIQLCPGGLMAGFPDKAVIGMANGEIGRRGRGEDEKDIDTQPSENRSVRSGNPYRCGRESPLRESSPEDLKGTSFLNPWMPIRTVP